MQAQTRARTHKPVGGDQPSISQRSRGLPRRELPQPGPRGESAARDQVRCPEQAAGRGGVGAWTGRGRWQVQLLQRAMQDRPARHSGEVPRS